MQNLSNIKKLQSIIGRTDPSLYLKDIAIFRGKRMQFIPKFEIFVWLECIKRKNCESQGVAVIWIKHLPRGVCWMTPFNYVKLLKIYFAVERYFYFGSRSKIRMPETIEIIVEHF